jgi:chemotaxis protein methyltransferase CheR
MNAAPQESQAFGDHINKRNFEKLAWFIYDYSGIKMPSTKLTMLEGRLRRRLRATGITSFDDYCDFLFDDGGLETEAVHLIDAVTTNKTDFFREPKHFEFLERSALPDLVAHGYNRLRAWSSACSTGAEPYTLAMVLAEFAERSSGVDYSILATDLSTDVLQTARLGIYADSLVEPVPAGLRRKYVMTPAKPGRREVRIVPKLRSRIGFGRMNLMDTAYGVGDPMHIVFCRNVLIYFDKPTQAKVLSRLCECLVPGGYLFIGHSESIAGIDLPVRQVSNTIFKRL